MLSGDYDFHAVRRPPVNMFEADERLIAVTTVIDWFTPVQSLY
jgi:hypothetical protein